MSTHPLERPARRTQGRVGRRLAWSFALPLAVVAGMIYDGRRQRLAAAREALARLGATHRTETLAVALVSPLRSIVAPFFGSASELFGGDPSRLHPLAQSRKLAHVGADGISHAAHVQRAQIVAAARSRLVHPDRPERLVPIGVCALLVVAAALGSVT